MLIFVSCKGQPSAGDGGSWYCGSNKNPYNHSAFEALLSLPTKTGVLLASFLLSQGLLIPQFYSVIQKPNSSLSVSCFPFSPRTLTSSYPIKRWLNSLCPEFSIDWNFFYSEAKEEWAFGFTQLLSLLWSAFPHSYSQSCLPIHSFLIL